MFSKHCLPLEGFFTNLHLRQDIVDEAVLDEVKVDQLVLELNDPPDG